jgi:hypothetical protein
MYSDLQRVIEGQHSGDKEREMPLALIEEISARAQQSTNHPHAGYWP